MKLAYLVNQYPQPSHSFIRREIGALEELGMPVSRYTLRRYTGPLPDPGDQREQKLAFGVLEQGAFALGSAVLWALTTRPKLALRSLTAALQAPWEPRRGPLIRLIYFSEACYLVRQWLRSGITHVHAHFGTNSTAVAMLGKLLGGPTYSFTCHGPEEFDRSETLGLGEKVRHSTFAVAISDFGRSQLLRHCSPTDWEKVCVVRCGVDETFLSPCNTLLPASPRLISIGRLVPQKGQLTLIEAASLVIREHPDLELLVVGDGPMRRDLEEAIKRAGLEKSVILLGWKSGSEIRELLESSRAFVLPSFAEGLPVVLMESLARERPAISSGIMGIPELVEPGVTGWLVPPSNASLLASAMSEALFTSPEKLQAMGKRGHDRVAELHSARMEAKRLLELFHTPPLSVGKITSPVS